MGLVRTRPGVSLGVVAVVVIMLSGCCTSGQFAHAQTSKTLPVERSSFGSSLKQNGSTWSVERTGDNASNRLVTYVEQAPRTGVEVYAPLYAQMRCDSGGCAGIPSDIKLDGLRAGSFSIVAEALDDKRLSARWWVYATGQWPTQHTPELSGGPQYRPGSGAANDATTAVFGEFEYYEAGQLVEVRHMAFLMSVPDGASWPANGCVAMRVRARDDTTDYEMKIGKADGNQSAWMFVVAVKPDGSKSVVAPRQLNPADATDAKLIAWLKSIRDDAGKARQLDAPFYP